MYFVLELGSVFGEVLQEMYKLSLKLLCNFLHMEAGGHLFLCESRNQSSDRLNPHWQEPLLCAKYLQIHLSPRGSMG